VASIVQLTARTQEEKMTVTYVKTKDVAQIVRATFPEYRKKQVAIWPGETVTFHDVNWSGGTKSEYRACTLDGKDARSGPDMGYAPPWANPFEGKSVEIPRGYCVVKGGHFCGKTATLYIHVHPADMPALLAHSKQLDAGLALQAQR
jgi:hypothetical protein